MALEVYGWEERGMLTSGVEKKARTSAKKGIVGQRAPEEEAIGRLRNKLGLPCKKGKKRHLNRYDARR